MKRSLRIALAIIAAAIPLQLAGPANAAAEQTWVALDGGRVGDVTWNVAAARSCLRVGAIWKTSPLSFLRQRNRACAPTGARPRPSQAPLVVSAVQPGSGADARITAVGMLVPAAVRKVEVTFSDGVGRSIGLRPLSPLQARKADLGGYQYAAFVFRGLWCAERTVTKSSGGRVLWDSGVDQYACD